MVSISALGVETHIGRAAVSLLQAVDEFNALKPFAIQLTHCDRSGVPSERGEVQLCGKLVATTAELWRLAQLRREAREASLRRHTSAKRPPAGLRGMSSKVDLHIGGVRFEPALEELEAAGLQTPAEDLFLEPFVAISIGGHRLQTEK